MADSSEPTPIIKVLSIGTVSSVLDELIPAYQRSSGQKIEISYSGPGPIVERLANGEPADVVIVPDVHWDRSEKTGRLMSSSKTALPATSYAVGLPSGSEVSEVITASYFKCLLENARSVALVDRSPSTPLIAQSLGTLGSQLEAKAKFHPNGSAVAEALAAGDVDMAITTLSELTSVPHVVIAGPVPASLLPLRAASTAAISANAVSPTDAAAFIRFLVSPPAIAAFRAKGFDAN